MTGENKKIIVTGASGYIASLIIKELLDLGKYNVVAVVRDQQKTSKYEFLKKLNGAAERLSFAYGDLETADYSSIFKDSYGIIHVASPYFYTSEDVQRDIVQPAITGNQRVLEAALKVPTIEKVIVTSSVAALYDGEKKKAVYDEDDWNESSGVHKSPYAYSKYLAEKSAKEFIENHKDEIKFKVSFINPGLVIGPSIDTTYLNTSIELFKTAISPGGEDNPMTQRNVAIVDVRDVAKAHIKALEGHQDRLVERYVMASDVKSLEEIAKIAQELYPQYQITIPYLKSPTTPYQIHSKSPLKLDSLIDLKVSIKDTIDWLINTGHYKPISK